MKCIEVIKYLEDWAPKEIAWPKDNVGLQIGSAQSKIKNIMLSLDLTEQVIDRAIKNKCNLLITHHPLLFKPLKKINTENDSVSRLIEKLIKNDLILYSAHTNLDFTKDGVSYQLAKKLKLQKINFLVNLSENQVKLTVFVPEKNVADVADAINQAGGGIIGEYSNCSFRIPGTGTFKGSDAASPTIGVKGKLEYVNEISSSIR